MPLSDFSPTTLRNILQQFCETSFNSILITSPELGYPILYANPRFCEMTGYSLQELMGQSPKIFQGEKTNPKILARLKETISAGEPFHGAAINYRKNGDVYPVEWNITPIKEHNGTITHYISVQKDLSHLKDVMSLLKRTNEHFREFLVDIARVKQKESGFEDKQQRLVSDILDNSRLYNSALRSEDNIQLFEEDEFFDCSHDVNGILPSDDRYEEVSAEDYNKKYNVSLDIQELANRIRETQEKIDLLAYSNDLQNELVEISRNFQEIANEIFYFDEFLGISSTLSELAKGTREYAASTIEPMVIDFYRGLTADLETWIDIMFIKQSAKDIHELDANIISAAKQLLHFLR